MKYWEMIADNLSKAPVGVGAVSQLRITKADNFGLPLQSAGTTESVLFCVRMNVSAFSGTPNLRFALCQAA